MASIYLARLESELGAERLVVVKQIHRTLSLDATFATQFIEEAKLCAGLRHANIAQVVDLGRGPASADDPGVLFMAMEYVEGLDLQKLLRGLAKKRIPLPPQFALHIVREVLTGLDFAHRARDGEGRSLGIVHRDVSPSNVLLSFEGEVKLCDFGIARAFGRAEEVSAESSGSRAAAGDDAEPRVVGKSAYMSPEQARGEALDARADVFAAAIMLYEMCAGRRLYKGTEREMLELARRAEIPPLPDLGLPGHASLAALLDRALAPDREARFESAKAMIDELDAYLIAHRMMSSQLRFAAFLTDHFADEIVHERRARELAARLEPSAPAPALAVPDPEAELAYARDAAGPPPSSPRAPPEGPAPSALAPPRAEGIRPAYARALIAAIVLVAVGATLYLALR